MTPIQETIINKKTNNSPIWLMRQAGRYLPEFRKIRKLNPDFINLCLNENLSSEITLQPLKRFDLDAAIIFSDILMAPYGLGQEVRFEKDIGPKLSLFNLNSFLNNNENNFTQKLNSVYEAIRITRNKLDKNKSLISFIGAPWTLVVYMFDLKSNKVKIDLEKLKKFEPEIKIVLNQIIKYLCAHITNQVKAGADTVQIFDSWAGLLPESKLFNFCYEPNKKIVNFCKKNNIPVICFPKGIKNNYKNFANEVKPDCLSLDHEIDPLWARNNLEDFCLQGGMDPNILFQEEDVIFKEIDRYLRIFKNHPYIFNLGHGLLPETNPDIVQKVVERVNNSK